MSGALAGRVAAWLSRLEWVGWQPSISVRIGEAHAHLVLEWSEDDLLTRHTIRLLAEEPERVWCARLDRAVHGAPGTVTLDGRPLVAEPTLVPLGDA